MAERRSRYRKLEQYITLALIAEIGLFVLYMIFAGNGVTWVKVFLAVLCFVISAACIAVLFFSQELMRARSLWMSLTAGAVALVLLFSLLLNFPSPNPKKQPLPGPVQDTAAVLMAEEKV